MFLSNKNILVTGGCGFIGSHLVEALQKNNKVTVVTRKIQDNIRNKKNISYIELDLRKKETIDLIIGKSFDVIIHLAGNALVSNSIKDPINDFENNVAPTLNILEALRILKIKHKKLPLFVLGSTIGVYGNSERELEESTKTRPESPYGVSKLTADLYTQVYSKVYGIKSIIIRYSSTFGPRLRKQMVFDIMEKIRKNPSKIEIFGTGDELRDLNYVENHVDGTVLVVEDYFRKKKKNNCYIYNIGYGKSVKIIDIVKMIIRIFRTKTIVKKSKRLQKGDIKDLRYNIIKIMSIGYKPKISVYNGLKKTFEWYKQYCVNQNKLDFVSVIIPTYNEVMNVKNTFNSIKPYLEEVCERYEILFVDDSSPDGTYKEINKLVQKNKNVRLVLREKRNGFGAALKDGIKISKGNYIFLVDCDLSQPPSHYVDFAFYFNMGYDMIVGSRYLKTSEIRGRPLYKKTASITANKIGNFMLGLKLSDTTHSFRAFRKGMFKELDGKNLPNIHPSFFVEFTLRALKAKKEIMEFPIVFTERKLGDSKLNVLESARSYLSIISRK